MLSIVTGANAGLGEIVARALAERGDRVILAVRNEEKGRAAAGRMPGETEVRRLDLADLASVRAFADTVGEPVGLLVNNAGLMAPPLQRTKDGFEVQFGTNHLGHFALTMRLLDRLRAAEDGRVLTVSSVAHRPGKMRWDDLNWEEGYQRWPAYSQSKLANLLFMRELGRREPEITSVGAHPGYAATELQTRGNLPSRMFMGFLNKVVAQSAEAGARPLIQAATDESLPSGAYLGPDGPGEWRGKPRLVGMSKAARSDEDAARLWEVSVELTGEAPPA